MPAWMKSTGRWALRGGLGFVIVFALAVGFGTTSGDVAKMRSFNDAVERWQVNPDFREAQIEYVELGSTAMHTRAAGIDTGAGIMFLRSLPGLPPEWRVNPTSQAHYDKFRSGPLVAYLHLTSETAEMLPDTIKMFQYIHEKGDPTDSAIQKDFLLKYRFEGYTVAHDSGAVDSVRRLATDVDARQRFAMADALLGDPAGNRNLEIEAYWKKFREVMKANPQAVPDLYRLHIAQIARDLGYPTDPKAMTPLQQHEVRTRLDEQIRNTDHELWRLKQVNDWQNGIWAQVYGTMYAMLINPTLTVRTWGRIIGPVLLFGWVWLAVLRRRPREASDLPPETPGELAPA